MVLGIVGCESNSRTSAAGNPLNKEPGSQVIDGRGVVGDYGCADAWRAVPSAVDWSTGVDESPDLGMFGNPEDFLPPGLLDDTVEKNIVFWENYDTWSFQEFDR